MTWLVRVRRRDRFTFVEGTEAGLRLMRRLTQWTLIGVAALTILLPATQFVTRDLSPLALVALGAALAFVGVVQWQLMLAGMAGFEGVTPAVWRVGGGRGGADPVGRGGRPGPPPLGVGAALLPAGGPGRVLPA